MVEYCTGSREVASSILGLGTVVIPCTTLVSVDLAENKDLAMGRSDIIVKIVKSCERLGRYKTINHYRYLYLFSINRSQVIF